MAGKIPAGEFNTKLSLDGAQAVETLKNLKNEIDSATKSWKAQEIQLKSAGDKLGAAKAKYEGLSETVNKQSEKLKNYKTILNELKERQSQVDTSTDKGKKTYQAYGEEIVKAQKQILSTTKSLASMQSQQERAKNSLEYYKSGLAQAQSELRKMSDSSRAYIDRLNAEGKTTQANREKLSQLSKSYDKLNEIYKIQSSELAKIASSSGKTSDAYLKQKQRVDETATSMAKAKTESGNLRAEIAKTNPSPFQRLKNAILGTNKEAEKTGGLFKKIFSANVLSSAFTSGISNLTSGFKNAISSGMQLDGQLGKIKAQWSGLGKSAKETQGLTDQMKELKANTSLSADQVQHLQVTMNRLTAGNTAKTKALSRSIAVIGDNTKMSSDQMLAFSDAMAKGLSGANVTAGAWNKMSKQAPGLGHALSKAAGMSEGAFDQMVKSGKMSSAQFEDLVAKVGKDGGAAFEKFSKTQGGAAKSMKESWDDLKAKMAEPLFNMKSSGMQQLSSLMQSRAVQDGAKMLGQGLQQVAKYAMQVLSYISKHKTDIVGIGSDLTDIAKTLAKDLWKDFAGIINGIASAFGLTSKNASKSKDPLKQLKGALDGLAKNKDAIQWIARAIIAIAAVKTIRSVGGDLFYLAAGGKKAYDKIKEIPGLGSAIEKGFSKTWGIMKSGFDNVGGWAKSAASKMQDAFDSAFKQIKSGAGKALSGQSFGGAFQSLKSAGGFGGLSTAGKLATGAAGVGVALDAGSHIIDAVGDKKGSKKQYEDAGKGIGAALGGGIGMYFGGPLGAMVGSQIGKVIGGWGGIGAKKFMTGWTSKKPPKNFWSLENLGWSTKDMFGKMGKGIESFAKSVPGFFKKNWKNIGLFLLNPMAGAINLLSKNKGFQKWASGIAKWASKTWDGMKKGVQKFGKNYAKVFNGIWNTVGKGISKAWGGFKKTIQKGTKDFAKNIDKFHKSTKKGWDNYWKGVGKNTDKFWKDSKKFAKKGTEGIAKEVVGYHKKQAKNWSNFTKGVSKGFSDHWEDLKKHSSGGTKQLLNNVEKYAKDTGKEWDSHFKDVKDGFTDFSERLKKNHGNWLDTLNDTLQDNLKKTWKNWNKHWDDTRKGFNNWTKDISKWSSDFGNNWNKGWKTIADGATKIFSNLFDGIKKLAKGGINSLIDIVNGGISAVDWVINKFGGSKKAVGKITHLATGTGFFSGQRRPITKPTVAMLNDGNDSPATGNKEGILRNGQLGIIQGRNRIGVLQPGDEILNASELVFFMQQQGIEHFANGTGFFGDIGKNIGSFFGGIGSAIGNATSELKKFFDLATKIIKNPTNYISKIFKFSGFKYDRGALKSMASGMFNHMNKEAQNWWKTLWGMVSNQLDDGGGAEGGLLGAMQKYGQGKPYVWGAVGPDSFDCSGLVQYALKKAFNKDFPHYSGAQYNASYAVSDPKPGDLVFFGPGGSEHVGVYAGGGRYYSAQSPAAGIGMGRVADVNEGAISYRRISGLNLGGDSGSNSSVKADGPLQKLIKRETGNGFWQFIGKLASLFGFGGDNGGKAADYGMIEQAAAAMKVKLPDGFAKKLMQVIMSESGNRSVIQTVHDMNSGGNEARGILQYTPGTFAYYAMPGHKDIMKPYDQLLAFFNNSDWENSIGNTVIWGTPKVDWLHSGPQGHRRMYAKGGIANQASIFGEAGAEMAIPLTTPHNSRSYELLGQTAAILASQDQNLSANADNSKVLKTLNNIETLLTAFVTSDSTIETNVQIDKHTIAREMDTVIRQNIATAMFNKKKGFSGI